MKRINRRNAIALGVTALSSPLVAFATPVAAKSYGPTEGTEIFPGVRLITLGTRDSHIKGFKTVAMEDVVYQPKAASEPRRVCRRPFRLSHAAMAGSSSMAK